MYICACAFLLTEHMRPALAGPMFNAYNFEQWIGDMSWILYYWFYWIDTVSSPTVTEATPMQPHHTQFLHDLIQRHVNTALQTSTVCHTSSHIPLECQLRNNTSIGNTQAQMITKGCMIHVSLQQVPCNTRLFSCWHALVCMCLQHFLFWRAVGVLVCSAIVGRDGHILVVPRRRISGT